MPQYRKRRPQPDTSPEALAGPRGRGMVKAMRAAQEFLNAHEAEELLPRVGETIRELPKTKALGKEVIQDSYYGGTTDETDDLLAGRGMLYLSEQRKLFLDCTSGHYQMTWGYRNPTLVKAQVEATGSGVVWDNHSNIPQWPVKRLAQRLVEIVNPDCPDLERGDFSKIIRSRSRLNTVLIGVCTGSVACETGLKLMLTHYARAKSETKPPVVITLDGNYHGTCIAMQHLRGMWPGVVRGIKSVTVEPNDPAQLERVFAKYGERIAGLWAEPIMMNREAIRVDRGYMRLARKLCTSVGAVMAVDEIQTGFWAPGIFMFQQYGITPDVVIVGKGLAAGFHPLSGVLYRGHLDVLQQYDSISTNGGAAMAAYVALANLAMLQARQDHVQNINGRFFAALSKLAADFPERIAGVRGQGLLAGLKFHDRDDAIAFHKRCVEAGLWVRVHAYHPGHSTLLAKPALCADERTLDFLVERMRELLAQ